MNSNVLCYNIDLFLIPHLVHNVFADYHYLFVDFLKRCQGEVTAGVIIDTGHKMGSRGGHGMGVSISMGSCMVKVLVEQTG